jgi:hypothetical protein
VLSLRYAPRIDHFLEPPSVYQLRILLRGISPLIWRRVLVRSNTSLTTALKGYFPQVLAWCQPLDTRLAYEFLQRWPTEAVQQADDPLRS